MLDVSFLASAALSAGLTAAIVMWLAISACSRLWCLNARWCWAVGAGLLVSGGLGGHWPEWPPREDRARFLMIVVPLTLVVETTAAAIGPARAAWALRVGLAAIVSPILLHDSVYLATLEGRDSPDWPSLMAAVNLAALAALLALSWLLLSALQARTSARSVHWMLSLDALAAAIAVALSGYAGGGLLGSGLAAAILGATLSSYADRQQPAAGGSLGMSVVGVFAVVLLGRFFASLPNELAICLLLAPLTAWLAELPVARRLAPRAREALRLACVAIPLVLIIWTAYARFVAAFSPRSAPPGATEVLDPNGL